MKYQVGLVLLVTLLAGCSQRQWYEGMQVRNRNDCLRLPMPRQAECMERIGPAYEEYEAIREQPPDAD